MSSITEVVTRALVRDVVVPVAGHPPVRIALVTLDNGQDHRRPTTFGPAGLAAVERTLAALRERTDLDAVAVTGKPYVFAVGADLSLLDHLEQRADVVAIGRLGHRVFGQLADLGVPTFALVNGPAMGGGLELALHCTYRAAASTATLSLPEVSLGIVPGWGGAWLLPHLVGPEAAVRVIVENPLQRNRQLDAATAVELGVVDARFEAADFLSRSLRWAADVVRGRTDVVRPEARHDPGAWAKAVAHGRDLADARTHGAAVAPYRALDLIEAARTNGGDDGFAAEDEALADLLLGPQAQASLYAFDLIQRRAKRPAGAPDAALARPITKVGVVGTGLMARQLALLAASRLLVPVVLRDRDERLVADGLAAINAEVDRLAGRGVFDPDRANRIRAAVTGGTEWEELADCDLVVEAVFEELTLKQDVLAELEAVVRPDCVIATNTSALSVTELAERATYPERVVGIHFFNPVAKMPLVEIVRTPQTDDATLATAFAVAKAAGKSAVLCADAPGFVVNRILSRFIDASASAVDDGTPPQVVEDAALGLGLPMGPLQLVELVGPQVALHVGDTMAAAFPERYRADSPTLRLLADRAPMPITAREADGDTVIDPGTAVALARPGAELSVDEVRDRVLAALADEVASMLGDGVVDDVRDIDLCLLLGAGWPMHLGGITPELRRRGLL